MIMHLLLIVYKEPYLLVYCESALEVYDVTTTKWVQSIPFRKVRKIVRLINKCTSQSRLTFVLSS